MIRCIAACVATLVVSRAFAQVSFTPPGTNPALQRPNTVPEAAAPAQPVQTPPARQAVTPPGVPVLNPRTDPARATRPPESPAPAPRPAAAEPKAANIKVQSGLFALAPSSLEITVADKALQALTISVWGEKFLEFVAVSSVPWLKVNPSARRPRDLTQKYTVVVDPAIPPGRHRARIDVLAPGTAAAPIRVPVVVNISEASIPGKAVPRRGTASPKQED